MTRGRLTRRKRKQVVRRLLAARDLAGLMELAGEDPSVAEALQSMLFEPDDLLRWRAIEALGQVAAARGEGDPDFPRHLLRRLLWSVNDESGASGWHSPEAIGAILVNLPSFIDEFGPILASLLNEEPLQRGAHWGVAHVARIRPDVFASYVGELTASLESADAFIRACAVLALRRMSAWSRIGESTFLAQDGEVVILYDHESGQLRETTAGQLAAGPPDEPAPRF